MVEGSAALGPGGMPVQASPVPLGDPNHYAFIFPIRPGETRFQITYQLPYGGSFKFCSANGDADRHDCGDDAEEHDVRRVGRRRRYTPVTEETTAQTFVARNVAPSQALDFTVSGSGQLPRDSGAAATAGSGWAGGDGCFGTGVARGIRRRLRIRGRGWVGNSA